MTGDPASAPAPLLRPLRVAVVAGTAAAGRLAALVGASGHFFAALDAAEAVVTDGDAAPLPGVPVVAVGAEDGDFAGLLPVDAGPAQLDAALRAVVAGLVVRPLPAPRRRFGPSQEEPQPLLTPREVEVLAAFSDGLSNKETARRLGISPHTVKFHGESLFRKLGAGSRAEAVAKGLRRQIVEV
jgi:two-component system, NarL family, nitrate/nitrite response regulator NarL